jgi:hypothetical protein
MLSSDQFPQQPYPRLRESYARTWAKRISEVISDEGDLSHPIEMLPSGREQAEAMLDMHLSDPSDSFAKGHLFKTGFLTRHQSKKDYSSWYN